MSSISFQDYTFEDWEADPGMKMSRGEDGLARRHKTEISRPYYTTVYPDQGSGSVTVTSTGSANMNFELPVGGNYLCPWQPYMIYLVATFAASAKAQLEIPGCLNRFDFWLNGVQISQYLANAWIAGAGEVLDTPLAKLCVEGGSFGLATNFNAYEPFVNTETDTIPLVTSGATAATSPNIFPAPVNGNLVGKTIAIPILYLGADGFLVDNDTLLPLGHIKSNLIKLQFAPNSAWSSQFGSASPAALSVTITNPMLKICCCATSEKYNAFIAGLIQQSRLGLHTMCKASQEVTQQISGISAATNITFNGLPQDVRYMECFAVSQNARGDPTLGYKTLTSINNGFVTYRYFIDSRQVEDVPVDCTNGNAYQQYLQVRAARLRYAKDFQRLECPAISPYIYSGVNSTIPAAYPSCASGASGNGTIYNSAFRACADVGSCNNMGSYRGTETKRVVLQLSTNDTRAVTWNKTNGTDTNPITDTDFVLLCHANALAVLGVGKTELYV